MDELILVSNPSKRRKKKTRARRRKMTALQLKYFGRGRKHRRRAKARRRVYRRANPHRRATMRRRKHHRVHHHRRNPSLRLSSIKGAVLPTVKAGFVGATGALGLDLLWGYGKSYLPASMQGGAVMYGVKLLGAILVGIAGNKLLRGRGQDMARGAATVVLHDALKAQLQVMVPSLPLGQYLSGSAPVVGYQRSIPYAPAMRMGQYLSGLGESCVSGDPETFDT